MTKYLLIKGKVQGVFFRATAKEVADRFGLKGWVKNADDDVEIVCQGEPGLVNSFIEWCRQGPSRAKVEKVEIRTIAEESFDKFEIKRD